MKPKTTCDNPSRPPRMQHILSRVLLTASTGLIALCALQPVQAQTIVRIGTAYENYSVKEGYAGDLEQLQQDKLAEQQPDPQQAATPRHSTERHGVLRHGVYVSDVHTSVYSDLDRDGYYTHFDITLDVDTNYGSEYVYARIYLRDDNSDYSLFHTTDTFEIYGNLHSDRYKLSSKLVSNYAAALYDLRIEVFIAGRNHLEDQIDASTHRNLFALPLEAGRLDQGPADSIVHEHAGASWMLLTPLGLLFMRRRKR